MKYEPSLDGVRAVAIAGVIVFHAWPAVLPGGFTGVDCFFVLSGYLITSVILHDMREGAFSMREFYLRRIQRLLPNATLMLLVSLALAFFLLPPSTGAFVGRHSLWSLFNLSNFFIWRNVGGYWGEDASTVPLLHTWSLGVEEQFYLLFPAVLAFLARRTARGLAPVVGWLTLGSFGLCLYATWRYPGAAFYLLPTRAWEMLLGAALAVHRVPVDARQPLRDLGTPRLREWAGWLGIVAIGAGCWFVSERQRFPGWVALLPTLGTTAVLVSVADGRGKVAKLLSLPAAVWIGRLSYSLYLWHWPPLVMGRILAETSGAPPQPAALAGLAAGIATGTLAYWAVEQPLRRRAPHRRRRMGIIAALFLLGICTSFGLAHRRLVADPDGSFEPPVFRGFQYSLGTTQPGDPVFTATRYYDVRIALRPAGENADWRSGGVLHPWGGGAPRVVVLGSSHALMHAGTIDDICRDLGVSVAFLCADDQGLFFPSQPGKTFPTESEAHEFDAARRKWLAAWKPDLVLGIDRWDLLEPGGAGFERKLREFAREILALSPRLLLFSQVPVLEVGENLNLREYAALRLKRTGRLPTIHPDGREPLRKAAIEAIETVSKEVFGLGLFRVDEPFHGGNADSGVRYAAGRSFFYVDDDHLSDQGSGLARERLREEIGRAVGR